MDILKLIKNRRTIRKYKNKPIPKKILDKIIEAGRWGPSPHNSQPWEFVVINKNSILHTELIKRIYVVSQQFSTAIKILFGHSVDIMKNAPVVILVYNNCIFSRKVATLGKPYDKLAYISEIEGISAAIQNMQILATTLKIGTAWLTMPLLAEVDINRLFNRADKLVAVLTLGYPAERVKRLVRKPMQKIARYID